MRLSTLGRLASGAAGLLFVTAAVAEAVGHGQLRMILLIVAGVLAAPVAVYLMIFLPAKPSRPTAAALPAQARPTLTSVVSAVGALESGATTSVQPTDSVALSAPRPPGAVGRRPSPRRTDRAALTR